MRVLAVVLCVSAGLLPIAPALQAQQPATPVSPDATATMNELRANGLFVRGLTQARLDNHEGAIVSFAAALDLVGDQGAILLAMAESYQQLDASDDALFFAAQAVETLPETVEAAMLLADLQRDAGRLEDALVTLGSLLERRPDADAARVAQSDLLTTLGRLTEAIEAHRARLGYVGDSRPVHRRLLVLYEQAGQDEEALGQAEALLAADPTSYVVRLDLARRYLDAERDHDARTLLEDLRADFPHDPHVALLLARAIQPDDAEGATALLADLGERADPEALFGEAAALFNRAQSDPRVRPDADAALVRVIEVEPRPDALHMLGRLRFEAGAYDEAATLLSRAVDAEPRRPDWWVLALDAALRCDDAALAERLADDALLLFPGQSTLLDPASEAYSRVDRMRDAAASLRSLPAPTASQLERLGDAEAALGNTEAARAAWERALERAPDSASLRAKLGRTP